jgi:hypothetical protein
VDNRCSLSAVRNCQDPARSIDAPNPALVEPKHAVLSALVFKVGLEIVPCAEQLAAVRASNYVGWLCVRRDAQLDRQAEWAFQFVIEILLHHDRILAPLSDDLQASA